MSAPQYQSLMVPLAPNVAPDSCFIPCCNVHWLISWGGGVYILSFFVCVLLLFLKVLKMYLLFFCYD